MKMCHILSVPTDNVEGSPYHIRKKVWGVRCVPVFHPHIETGTGIYFLLSLIQGDGLRHVPALTFQLYPLILGKQWLEVHPLYVYSFAGSLLRKLRNAESHQLPWLKK